MFGEVRGRPVRPDVVFAATALGAAVFGLCSALVLGWRPSAVELSMLFLGALLAAPLSIAAAKLLRRG